MHAARYYKFNHPNSFVTSGGMGTMGFGLPAGLGAKIARPDKEVITFVGDGGFQMTIQELGTIMQYNVPVKIIVLNNNYLGMVRQWQEFFYDKNYSATPMKGPDFVKIAEAHGLTGLHVTHRDQVVDATIGINRLISRSFAVPKIFVRTLSKNTGISAYQCKWRG